ncbi:MAG: KpsF/GutQ family sugar-phosphate isomerase [Flavobacteriales bacterium]|nr:KpsF/GutQ family sugar-phosphate isomerase [Flavobacteriales bacterium]
MTSKKNGILDSARKTLLLESNAIEHLADIIGREFEDVVKLLLKSKGRLILTGIGKSGNIAQKLVATFISTGQPAVFMHAADAIHGDLGNVQKDDIVICISKSGDSPEIKVLVPLLKSMGNVLIGMVSNENSFLAKQSHIVLHTPVEKEACPNNLAPTTSTTLQLAMGDALAVALMECRGFSAKDFAKYHPGGALGKKLYVKVSDLLGNNAAPAVKATASIEEVILEISSKRLGATAVMDKSNLVGVITDGDLRRMLQRKTDFTKLKAKDIMSRQPKVIDGGELAVEAFHMMESNNITSLIVTKSNKYKGIVHLHDILKEGIF